MLYAILDRVVDDYAPVTDGLENEVFRLTRRAPESFDKLNEVY